MRVKSFDAYSHDHLERQINTWLESNKPLIVDIKMAAKRDHYWALVIYKPQ